MSSRILTTSIAGIDAFMRDPRGVLTHAEGGTVAVFADNAPAFYAITPERLAQLLETEAQLSRPASDVTLDNQLFDEPVNAPVTVPMGKFALYLLSLSHLLPKTTKKTNSINDCSLLQSYYRICLNNQD